MSYIVILTPVQFTLSILFFFSSFWIFNLIIVHTAYTTRDLIIHKYTILKLVVLWRCQQLTITNYCKQTTWSTINKTFFPFGRARCGWVGGLSFFKNVPMSHAVRFLQFFVSICVSFWAHTIWFSPASPYQSVVERGGGGVRASPPTTIFSAHFSPSYIDSFPTIHTPFIYIHI